MRKCKELKQLEFEIDRQCHHLADYDGPAVEGNITRKDSGRAFDPCRCDGAKFAARTLKKWAETKHATISGVAFTDSRLYIALSNGGWYMACVRSRVAKTLDGLNPDRPSCSPTGMPVRIYQPGSAGLARLDYDRERRPYRDGIKRARQKKRPVGRRTVYSNSVIREALARA
jgi:hypothetical protein